MLFLCVLLCNRLHLIQNITLCCFSLLLVTEPAKSFYIITKSWGRKFLISQRWRFYIIYVVYSFNLSHSLGITLCCFSLLSVTEPAKSFYIITKPLREKKKRHYLQCWLFHVIYYFNQLPQIHITILLNRDYFKIKHIL